MPVFRLSRKARPLARHEQRKDSLHDRVAQAFRIVIPPMTNELVLILKDTSLLYAVGLEPVQRELTSVGRDFLSSGPTTGTSTALTQVALLYLIITLPLTRLVAWLEKRQQRAR